MGLFTIILSLPVRLYFCHSKKQKHLIIGASVDPPTPSARQTCTTMQASHGCSQTEDTGARVIHQMLPQVHVQILAGNLMVSGGGPLGGNQVTRVGAPPCE